MRRPRFKAVIVPPDADYPFYIIANRYEHPHFPRDAHQRMALTLILMHSTSFHKEVLEPMLEDVFRLTSDDTTIREAWIIECPNHGESAILNESTLRQAEYEQYCKLNELVLVRHLFRTYTSFM